MSNRPAEELSERERQYPDGSDPDLLDIIDIPLICPRPKSYQSENWLLDPQRRWVRVGRANWQQLTALVDHPGILWFNGSSTYHGVNDRVTVDQSHNLHASLFLLHLPKVLLRVFAPGRDFGDPKRRVQACFSHQGVHYRLRVTDPLVEQRYVVGEDGNFGIGECFATVSLGEPFEGYCYKLVAALITPPEARR